MRIQSTGSIDIISEGTQGPAGPPSKYTETVVDYSALVTDRVIGVDASSADVTITLPAITVGTIEYTIKRLDSSAYIVYIVTTGSDTIESQSTYELITQYEYVMLASDGTSKWLRLSEG